LNWPSYLPDGKRFLYLREASDKTARVMLAEPGRAPRAILSVSSIVQYAEPGYLFFAREGGLLAQLFDWRTGRLSGEPLSIAEHVDYFETSGHASFGVSLNGTIAYQSHESASRIVFFDRTGRETGAVGTPGNYLDLSMTRDGRRLYYDRAQPGSGPTTSGRSTSSEASNPASLRRPTPRSRTGASRPGQASSTPRAVRPSPSSIAWTRRRGERSRSPRPRDLPDRAGTSRPTGPPSPTSSGRRRVPSTSGRSSFGRRPPDARAEIPLQQIRGPLLARRPLSLVHLGRIGPAGGLCDALSGPGERTRVSVGGARLLDGAATGRELFYVSADRKLVSVPVGRPRRSGSAPRSFSSRRRGPLAGRRSTSRRTGSASSRSSRRSSPPSAADRRRRLDAGAGTAAVISAGAPPRTSTKSNLSSRGGGNGGGLSGPRSQAEARRVADQGAACVARLGSRRDGPVRA